MCTNAGIGITLRVTTFVTWCFTQAYAPMVTPPSAAVVTNLTAIKILISFSVGMLYGGARVTVFALFTVTLRYVRSHPRALVYYLKESRLDVVGVCDDTHPSCFELPMELTSSEFERHDTCMQPQSVSPREALPLRGCVFFPVTLRRESPPGLAPAMPPLSKYFQN